MSFMDWNVIFHYQLAGTKITDDTQGVDVDEDGVPDGYWADEPDDDNGHTQGTLYETDGDVWHWVDYDDDGIIDYNEVHQVA